MNAEIVARLSRSLDEDQGPPQVTMDLLYPMAAAVAERTTTALLHTWLSVAEREGGSGLPSVEALKALLAEKEAEPNGAHREGPEVAT